MKHIVHRSRPKLKQAIALALLMFVTATVNAQPPATLVVTDQIKTLEFHNQVTLIGRAEANHASRVVSTVAGVVSGLPGAEGVPVSFGDPLVTVLETTIRLRYMAKKSEAAQAKAQADLAMANLKRAEQLFEEKAISESRMQTETANATVALERYNQLTAEANELKTDLDNCTIIAPYDGFTVRRLVDGGEWVSPGTAVFEVVDLSKIKITVDLPEKYYGSVVIGSPATVVISDAKQTTLTGSVTGIAPNASAETHTFPVYVTVDNSDGKLAGGMLTRATLNLNERFSSLAVTKDAIVRQGPSEMIYTINEGKAAPLPVRSTATSGEYVAIAGDGLAEGMVVVVRGNERIFPGSPVRTADGAPAGSAEPQQKQVETTDGESAAADESEGES